MFSSERPHSVKKSIQNQIGKGSAILKSRARRSDIAHFSETRQTRLLRAQAGEVDLVITHWPATVHAITPERKGDDLNSYFVNDREGLVKKIVAQIWISGHVQDPFDYVIGETRAWAIQRVLPEKRVRTLGSYRTGSSNSRIPRNRCDLRPMYLFSRRLLYSIPNGQ